ncbi:hypothetical protein OIU84_028727 [Salix udensis]|uniref:CRM domain-containing protein n=1 Tax=Salix udensis TaxID=889485 RepID=A0AAD6P9B3_9ROSI|nr:hypothetical protein OIU84_028727 [Salix udensis]
MLKITTPSFVFANNNTKELAVLTNPISQSDATSNVKVPAPPWNKGPLILQPHELLNLTNPVNKKPIKNDKIGKDDKALTAKESGVRGQQSNDKGLEKKLPWVREERVGNWRLKKEKVVSKAELSLDKELLERLRGEAAKMRTWVKVKKAGVTQSAVDEIRLTWRTSELAMIKFYMPLCRNMNRARDIVEMKTGGLVVWTRKDIHVVYRGCNYQWKKNSNTAMIEESFPRNGGEEESKSAGILMEADLNTQTN